MLRGLERVAEVAGPWHDELVGAMALAHESLRLGQPLAPPIGRDRLPGDVSMEDRPSAASRDLDSQVAVAAELDDAASRLVDRLGHGVDLLVGGDVRRRQSAVPVEVPHVAFEREPDRPRLEALTHDRLHRRDLVLGGVALLRGLTHDVAAHRRVADQRRDVHAQPMVEGVEVFGNRLPAPRHAGPNRLERDRLDVREHAGEHLAVLLVGGRQGEGAVADDDRRRAVVAGEGA